MTLRAALIALGLIALAGCGRQASLERPGPLTGRAAGTHAGPERTERDKAAARARADAVGKSDPVPPQSIDEVRNLGLPRTPTGSGTPAEAAEPQSQPSGQQ